MSEILWIEPTLPDQLWEIISQLEDEVQRGIATKDDENYADGRFLDMVQAIIKIDGQHMTDGECLEAIMVLANLWAKVHR
jgi:hypothetical protein